MLDSIKARFSKMDKSMPKCMAVTELWPTFPGNMSAILPNLVLWGANAELWKSWQRGLNTSSLNSRLYTHRRQKTVCALAGLRTKALMKRLLHSNVPCLLTLRGNLCRWHLRESLGQILRQMVRCAVHILIRGGSPGNASRLLMTMDSAGELLLFLHWGVLVSCFRVQAGELGWDIALFVLAGFPSRSQLSETTSLQWGLVWLGLGGPVYFRSGDEEQLRGRTQWSKICWSPGRAAKKKGKDEGPAAPCRGWLPVTQTLLTPYRMNIPLPSSSTLGLSLFSTWVFGDMVV